MEHNCPDKNELLANTKANIERFGLQVILVNGTDYSPPFAYSVGLWETFNHPEIICFGLPRKVGHVIINDLAEIIKKGEIIKVGKDYFDIFRNSRATFLNVDKRNYSDYLGTAIKYFNSKDFQTLELIWTDRKDKFPWEEEFEVEFIHKQPLLDRNANFKYREPENLGVFTTRQWLEDGKDILRVVHDSEGDWQFLTGNQLPEDIKIVCLKNIVQKDLTLNEVFDLNYGQSAERKFLGDKWVTISIE